VFNLDMGPTKILVAVLLVETEYVVAVYDTSVVIFNAASGDFLQETGRLDSKNQTNKFRYKSATINIAGTDIYLAAHNVKEAKNTVQSEIHLMKEVTVQEQIDYLLGTCRIQEAREVFLTRGNKTAVDFMQRNRMFNMDAGWQLLLNRVDYKQVVDWFKLADIDPRELILLFKDLYDSSPTIRKYHVKSQPKHFLKQLLTNIKMTL